MIRPIRTLWLAPASVLALSCWTAQAAAPPSPFSAGAPGKAPAALASNSPPQAGKSQAADSAWKDGYASAARVRLRDQPDDEAKPIGIVRIGSSLRFRSDGSRWCEINPSTVVLPKGQRPAKLYAHCAELGSTKPTLEALQALAEKADATAEQQADAMLGMYYLSPSLGLLARIRELRGRPATDVQAHDDEVFDWVTGLDPVTVTAMKTFSGDVDGTDFRPIWAVTRAFDPVESINGQVRAGDAEAAAALEQLGRLPAAKPSLFKSDQDVMVVGGRPFSTAMTRGSDYIRRMPSAWRNRLAAGMSVDVPEPFSFLEFAKHAGVKKFHAVHQGPTERLNEDGLHSWGGIGLVNVYFDAPVRGVAVHRNRISPVSWVGISAALGGFGMCTRPDHAIIGARQKADDLNARMLLALAKDVAVDKVAAVADEANLLALDLNADGVADVARLDVPTTVEGDARLMQSFFLLNIQGNWLVGHVLAQPDCL
jgi:hypothetical protein